MSHLVAVLDFNTHLILRNQLKKMIGIFLFSFFNPLFFKKKSILFLFRIIEKDGAKIVVDEDSLEKIQGSKLDFSKELIRESFAVKENPLAETGCGCGTSFHIKNDIFQKKTEAKA